MQNHIRSNNSSGHAFTVVEMLVVISIIGILVALSSFGYRTWQTSMAQREAKSDLAMLSTAMQSAKNFGSGYPTSIPTNFNKSNGVTLTYRGGNASGYCIEARSKSVNSVLYNIKAGSEPAMGGCDVSYTFGAPSPTVSSTSTNSITLTWPAVAGASGYRVNYGTASPSSVAACTGSPCVISGLASTTLYRLSVTATSAFSSKTSGTINASTSGVAFAGPSYASSCAIQSGGYNIGWPTASGISRSYYVIEDENGYQHFEGTINPYSSSLYVVDVGQGGNGGNWNVMVQYINTSGQYSTPSNLTVNFGATDCYN